MLINIIIFWSFVCFFRCWENVNFWSIYLFSQYWIIKDLISRLFCLYLWTFPTNLRHRLIGHLFNFRLSKLLLTRISARIKLYILGIIGKLIPANLSARCIFLHLLKVLLRVIFLWYTSWLGNSACWYPKLSCLAILTPL